MTDALTTFLRARIDKDAAVARAAIEDDGGEDGGFEDADYLTNGSTLPRFGDAAAHLIRTFAVPARVLAEVEGKLLIVDAYLPPGADPHPGLPCTDDIEHDPDGEIYAGMVFPDACVRHLKASERLLHHDYVLRLLALPYADHPDYLQEWRP